MFTLLKWMSNSQEVLSEIVNGELWLMASPTKQCRMDSTILLVDRKWEGSQFYWPINFRRAESVN